MHVNRYRIADVDVAIEAPEELIAIVAESYRRFPQPRSTDAHANVSVHTDDGQFSLRIGEKPYASMSTAAGRGIIGIELSNAIITAVAQHSRFLILHAAVLERNGEALCVAGRGMSGKTLMATHLISRGWRILSDEYAFIEPVSGQIVPFPKLLFVRSTSLPHMPRSFRKSVECSPWYGMGELTGIVFSGVDPARSYTESIWSTGARLTHLLVIEGRGEQPVITPADPWSLVPELHSLVWQSSDILECLSKVATATRGVRTARLTPGSPLQTANALERWVSHGALTALSA